MPNMNTSLAQPHYLLNIISIIFFCIGCIMMMLSTHTQDIKLIMPGCSTPIINERFPIVKNDVSYSSIEESSSELNLNNPNIPDFKEIDNIDKMENKTANKIFNNTGIIHFVSHGNLIHFTDALKWNVSYNENEHVSYSKYSSNIFDEGNDLGDGGNQEIDTLPKINLFIAITSSSIGKRSQMSRKEIRRTWIKNAEKLKNVDIKFFLGQPPEDKYEETVKSLKSELEMYNDIVFIRGLEKYENLPNKTFGILKYAISSPSQYTHVLKTDDDCYVRVDRLLNCLFDTRGQPLMKGLYMGCLENRYGFMPIRDTNSKWFLHWDEFPDSLAADIRGTKYLAGWGYILSRDVILHAMKKVSLWQDAPDLAPSWYSKLPWEDVMMGCLLSDEFEPTIDFHFKAAWRACTNETAVRHLDIDAPMLFSGLYEQEKSGLWDKKTVQCSFGKFIAGDYSGWKRWRNSVVSSGSKV